MTIEAIQGEIITPTQWKASTRTAEQEVADDIGPANAVVALAICDELAGKTEGLEHIAARCMGKEPDKGPNAARVFYQWRNRSAALSRIYARACASRSHVIAHQVMDVIEHEPDGVKARVKLDAIKWLAAKFNRAEFGDDIQVNGNVQHEVHHSGDVLATIEQRLAKRAKRLAAPPKNENPADGG